MNYEDNESYRKMESILDEELKRRGLEVEPVDENARAESTLTKLFDVMDLLKRALESPSIESVIYVEAALSMLEPDTLRAMVCTLIGMVTTEQLDEHRVIAVESCRTGEIVQLAKEFGEQTR